MKFEETYLNDNILDALYDMHFEEMTPIQERCMYHHVTHTRTGPAD